MKPQFKNFTIDAKRMDEVKLAKGQISVVFATMNIVDKDGDVTLPGFYGEQTVAMVPVHDWDHVPIGKGLTVEVGEEAVADIQMNLEIQAAKDWLSQIKFDLTHGKPIQEYSYGFKVLEGGSRQGTFNGKNVRFLQPREGNIPGSKIWEVSPVLVGAGEKTRTLSAKGAPMKFSEEILSVLDAAEELVSRGKSLADLRAKDGRELSTSSKERFAMLADCMVKTAQELTGLIAPKAAALVEADPELLKEVGRMLRIRAGNLS